MVTGLLVFAVLFAINSSLHSYLILSFTNTERVARDVGFYYMSNCHEKEIVTAPSSAVTVEIAYVVVRG